MKWSWWITFFVLSFISGTLQATECEVPDIADIDSRQIITDKLEACATKLKYAKMFNAQDDALDTENVIAQLEQLDAFYVQLRPNEVNTEQCKTPDISSIKALSDISDRIEHCNQALLEAKKFNRTGQIEQAKLTLNELESLSSSISDHFYHPRGKQL